jgi:CBS domain-containing protein
MSELHKEFLDLFNKLDFLLRQKLGQEKGVSHSSLLSLYGKQDSYFKQFESSLHVYKDLRNVLVHGTLPGQNLPIAVPDQRVVDDYGKIIEHLSNPKTALETIAIREVYSVAWDDSIFVSLKFMMEKGYRLAPVLSSGRIVGMFTESTLAQSLVADGDLKLKLDTTFRRFEEFSSFEHVESIEGVEFTAADASVKEVESVFQSNFEKGRFTSVVCITPDGKPRTELLGIVTAHDLPSASGFDSMS